MKKPNIIANDILNRILHSDQEFAPSTEFSELGFRSVDFVDLYIELDLNEDLNSIKLERAIGYMPLISVGDLWKIIDLCLE